MKNFVHMFLSLGISILVGYFFVKGGIYQGFAVAYIAYVVMITGSKVQDIRDMVHEMITKELREDLKQSAGEALDRLGDMFAKMKEEKKQTKKKK